MNWEKHLIFRTNLNLDLFNTGTVSEETIHLYNEVGLEAPEGMKNYFEFFFWTMKYMLANNQGFEAYKSVVNDYKTVNELTAEDEEFILLAYKINEITLFYEDVLNEHSVSIVDKSLALCESLNITDTKTLLTLARAKLHVLLYDVSDFSAEKAEALEAAKYEVEKFNAKVLIEPEPSIEGFALNTIFL